MAKYIFTQAQFDEISMLLKRRNTEPRDKQKTTRAKIRRLGFNISDYFNGFSENDFQSLLAKKEIEIIGASISKIKSAEAETKSIQSVSKDKDEHYVLNICDEVLGYSSFRQHKFEFLLGDPNKNGVSAKLPVDSYYPELHLVIEYYERQHTEEVKFFDKPNKMTVSGVHRGEQRKIYDDRRREVLPKHNIALVEISYTDFKYDNGKRIIRDKSFDEKIIRDKLKEYIK